MKNKRGSVLVHVLIMGVIMAIIAAGLMSVMMLQYKVTGRMEQGSEAKKRAEVALAKIISNWNENGYCTSTNLSGYSSCAFTAPCTCTCSGSGMPTITGASVGGSCQIKINALIQ